MRLRTPHDVDIMVVVPRHDAHRPRRPPENLPCGRLRLPRREERSGTAYLHATVLHRMGMDYSKVYYRHNGRDERLTDVFEPKVIRALLA